MALLTHKVQTTATYLITTSVSALFRCSADGRSSHTPNWPVVLALLLLHPPGTLPADIRQCENFLTFKRHLKTHLFKLTQSSCAATSASVSSGVKALYKCVIIIILLLLLIIIIIITTKSYTHSSYGKCIVSTRLEPIDIPLVSITCYRCVMSNSLRTMLAQNTAEADAGLQPIAARFHASSLKLCTDVIWLPVPPWH